MVKNRAHNETKEIIFDALNGPPIFSISLLNLAIERFFNNELSLTAKNKQTTLLFLGVHASALTFSEALWGIAGFNGYKKFLETFMDGEMNNKFSQVARKIYDWRNVLAHQFVSHSGHDIDYDYEMADGYTMSGDDLIINPEIYLNSYLEIFSRNKIIDFFNNLDENSKQEIRKRIIRKYLQQ